MINLTGYQLIQKLHENPHTLIYRGYREKDNKCMIFKILKADYPTVEALAHYHQEYEILKKLNIEGVVKTYGLIKYQNTNVLLLEDIKGHSLKDYINQHESNLLDDLHLMVCITKIIEQLHYTNVIHKDINPNNIIFYEETGRIAMIDFGIATQLSSENTSFEIPNKLEGTLAYVSPEQTGRLSHTMDYRSDLYSLGITFYELLTHRLPFKNDDVMALIHSHLAEKPIPPADINPQIPDVLSNIIMKLLEKTAESRYQSAWGLRIDLENCLQQLKNEHEIKPFLLSQYDVTCKFQLPQKLYGREKEIQQLATAFNNVRKGQNQLLLISGEIGIGKTTLVQEMYKTVSQQQAYFIQGHFESLQKDVPYAALVEACDDLIQQLLTESKQQLTLWRDKINRAVGNKGQLLVNLIPDLALIINTQAKLPTLQTPDTKNYVGILLRNLLQVFATPAHPLVLFLDDLQWIDNYSLYFLTSVIPHISHLLVIGSYRPEDVNDSHLLNRLFENEQAHQQKQEIKLKTLDLKDIQLFLYDTFKASEENNESLATLLLEKTQGNPFFMRAFLTALYQEKSIYFELPRDHQHTKTSSQWQWNLAQIKAKDITDNVINVMLKKIDHLPEQAQHLLKFAACIGREFNLQDLSVAYSQETATTAHVLQDAISENIILPLAADYHTLALNNEDTIEATNIIYKFAHERLHRAVYKMIPEELRLALHHQIGYQLLNDISLNDQEKHIFTIVEQLNISTEFIILSAERQKLAHLNLMAGKKARALSSYETSTNYLKTAIKLSDETTWQQHTDFMLNVYCEAIQVAYCMGNFNYIDLLTDEALQHNLSLVDSIKIYELKIQACIAQNQLNRAVQIALSMLQSLKMPLPQDPSPYYLNYEFLKTKAYLMGKNIQQLYHQPSMTDAHKRAAMTILARVASATYLTNSKLYPLVVLKMVQLVVKHGHHPFSALAYASYGLILCGLKIDIERGYQFGQLAYQLLEDLENPTFKPVTLLVINGFIRHWKEPLKDFWAELLEVYHNGVETGELEAAAYSARLYCTGLFLSGHELNQLKSVFEKHAQNIVELKQQTASLQHAICHQAVLNLLGQSAHPHILEGEVYKQAGNQRLIKEEKTSLACLYVNQLMLSYLFGHYQEAVSNAENAEPYLANIVSGISSVIFDFYVTLARLAIYPLTAAKEKMALLKKIRIGRDKLKKWAKFSPENYLHKYYLVEAEYTFVLDNHYLARDYYDQAIALAQQHEYIHEEALAQELAGKFYLSKGLTQFAHTCLHNAYYAYTKWGAKAKVKHLEACYPYLLMKTNYYDTSHALPTTTEHHFTQTGSLEFVSVLKASQTLASEIMLDKLLEKLMKIVIENAGAQRGFLLLPQAEQWAIEAQGTIDKEKTQILQSIPLSQIDIEDKKFSIPKTIINYVARVRETIVLDHAVKSGKFTQDPHIIAYQTQSVLCMPLLNKGKLAGILYLENNINESAFTPERLETLNLLTAQIAISIENSRLYTSISRFLPREFLNLLEKDSVTEVKLGDHVEKEMTVLFSDIRGFTSMSEKMSPQDNFDFINAYLSRMEPVFDEHHGFIDKYIGDAIMALFPESVNHAVNAAINMLQTLTEYNLTRGRPGRPIIEIGIGIHVGILMLGTIGGKNRMDGTVISDAVNLAARVEELTKIYGSTVLITEQTYRKLHHVEQYKVRLIDRVQVKGKTEAVTVYEVFDADPEMMIELKLATLKDFEQGFKLYHQQRFAEAYPFFEMVLSKNESDEVAQVYLDRCQDLM